METHFCKCHWGYRCQPVFLIHCWSAGDSKQVEVAGYCAAHRRKCAEGGTEACIQNDESG
eukprot:3490861-Karenia_brevis.AAC.1